jgi:hypothetical protein
MHKPSVKTEKVLTEGLRFGGEQKLDCAAHNDVIMLIHGDICLMPIIRA